MKIVSRKEWGFDGWRSTPRSARLSDWGYVTFHYDGEVPCGRSTGGAMVKNIHKFHKNGRGWAGIGYNYVIDSAGNIFEGRGLDYHGAHKPSGVGNNSNGIGVQFHIGGSEELTPAMKNAANDLMAYLNQRTGRKLKVSWHNQGYATSCPGSKVLAWIKAGCPRGSGSVSKPAAPAKTPSAAQKPTQSKPTLPTSGKGSLRGPFPLPKGHWYGPNTKLDKNHSGGWAKDVYAVKLIQQKVGAGVDGIYGSGTAAKVKVWQKAHGLAADGLVGEVTWKKMAG